MNPESLDTRIIFSFQMSYSANLGHRPSLRLSDSSGLAHAVIPHHAKEFFRFFSIMCQQFQPYRDTITTAYERANEWHTAGSTELSGQDLERAHALFTEKTLDRTSFTRTTWIGLA